MDNAAPPPPPPPPHGENPQSSSNAGGNAGRNKRRGDGLPDGNYDIFIVPPHSSGGGFIYFPSLQPQRNSFIAGSVCTLLAVGIWLLLFPVLKEWFQMVVASGAAGVALLLICVGGGAWVIARATFDSSEDFPPGASKMGGKGSTNSSASGGGAEPGAKSYDYRNYNHSRAKGGFDPGGGAGDSSQGRYYQQGSGFNDSRGPSPQPTPDPNEEKRKQWEKQREEIRRKNEQKKREEEAKRRLDEYRRKKQEEAEAKKKQQEQDEIKKQQHREREQREREARERRERLQKDQDDHEQNRKERDEVREREKIIRERAEKLEQERAERAESWKAAQAATDPGSPKKPSNFRKATAHTEIDPEEMHSFRPYDKPKQKKAPCTVYTSTSASSFAASSYADSDSTSRTTPPPMSRDGAYRSADPDAIVIKGAYAFNNMQSTKPYAELVAGFGNVGVGLVLRITTEGMFIDDEGRGSPQREWDTKAWTLKMIETGTVRNLHLIRTNIRDVEGRKFVFVYTGQEKRAADGLQRLRKGPNTRGLTVSMLETKDVKAILERAGCV